MENEAATREGLVDLAPVERREDAEAAGRLGRVGNFTRRKFKIIVFVCCGFWIFEILRKSPQNKCIDFSDRSESPRISAEIPQKTRLKSVGETEE